MESKQLLVQDVPLDTGKASKLKFWKYLNFRRRYVVAFLSFLGFVNVYTLRVSLSVSVIAMEEEFADYTSKKYKGLVLAAFFYGYIVTQIPGGWIASRYGGKKLFGISVIITSVLCILTPYVAKDYRLLVALRVLQGLAEGSIYPAAHAVWSRWAPASERSRLATISFSGSYIGTVLSLSLSGYIIEKYGWPSIFYSFGTAGLIWSVIWLWNVGEEPRQDKFIQLEEAEYIQSSLGVSTSGESPPWMSMLTSKPVWAINIAHFSENWGFYTLLTLLPSYMKDTFETTPLYSGIISSLPYLLMAVVVQLAGSAADKVRQFKSTTFVRKTFTCSAFVTQTLFTFIAGQSGDPVVSIVCLTLAVGLGGFAWAGFSVNHLDIGANWAGILMGISNTFATIPGMVSPLLAGGITGESTDGWQTVFTVSALVYLIGAILYGILAEGEEQDWARRQFLQDDDDDDSD